MIKNASERQIKMDLRKSQKVCQQLDTDEMLVVPPDYTDYASYFSDTLRFLSDYSWLYNFANTNLLVCKVLDKVPQDWSSALLSLSNEELNRLPQGFMKQLKIPVRIAVKHDNKVPSKIQKGLTPKKQHEISSLAAFVNSECSVQEITNVLDVGSGLLLSYEYGFSIIGLESQPERVKTAHTRQTLLCHTSTVTHITCNVAADSKHVVESALQNANKPTCLVGLHACGDLAVSAIQLFLRISLLETMVLVPCCYHKMELSEENEFVNFPLSASLRDMVSSSGKSFLSRPFLRLASQESAIKWQNMTKEEHGLHSENTMAQGVVLKKKHRRAVKKTNRSEFHNFMEDALSRYEFQTEAAFDISSARNKMIDMWNEHKHSCRLVEAITALQMAIQTIAEGFVIADRAAYLLENGISSVEVVKVMDNVLSPRCYALVAKK
ncbi:hypothetical protein C0J52_13137 [Blattella germanica]|nr:hypothetical protein C0J52_13137 [Blattella germanica]